MPRYRFTIEYDGSRFESGWQKQNNGKTSVQGSMEDAAFHLTQSQTRFYPAGRTDRNVHALGQVVHADFSKYYPLKSLHDGMNWHLHNSGCRVVSVAPCNDDFHARFSAKSKTYFYVISHSRTCSIFDQNRVWWIHNSVELNIDLMKLESNSLIGEHDFSSFRDRSCQAVSPIRSIEAINFLLQNNKIIIEFVARSFLHKQIRIMMGTLVDIGRGRLSDISGILSAKDRARAGQTAPGYGLFLKNVSYV